MDMDIGKSYKVDDEIFKLDKIHQYSDGSRMYVFSNEEYEEYIVTSYSKTPPYYNHITPVTTIIWSSVIIPV